MAQPVWITPEGSIGTFSTGVALDFTFVASVILPATNATYKILNGTLPEGTTIAPVKLNPNGSLVGTPKTLNTEQTFTFTIRATDNTGNIRDRTFSLTLYGSVITISTPIGLLLDSLDSVYIDYQLKVINVQENVPYIIELSSGALPPGLYIDDTGRITGYAKPPFSSNGTPTEYAYAFSVQLTSAIGLDNKSYSIKIRNQQLTKPPNSRLPVILNNTPLIFPVPLSDPYYGYYLPENNIMPTAIAGEYFSFKIIGYDFDGQDIQYSFGSLPPGLTGNLNTGWITGIPTIADNTISEYSFIVQVVKGLQLTSKSEKYTLTITNGIEKDVVWVTPNDLGIVYNGDNSYLSVVATSSNDLKYIVTAGTLPPNIELLENGQLVGRFPSQPSSNGLLTTGDYTDWTFTIKAYNPQFSVVNSERIFTVRILQEYATPTDNIYFKATPNIAGRTIINSLLTDETLIPNSYLYRPEDYNFGKATEIRYVHVYGVEPTNLQTYINAINENHYNRKFILGELKTAVAKDENNNVLYEVVYSTIIDDLINPAGKSIPQSIFWPKPIPLDQGPYFTSNDEIFTATDEIYTSYTFGSVIELYPASTVNMQNELLRYVKQNTNQNLLPKWMTSQQADGNTLGFVRAWVVCYTKPGYSQTIVDNINNNWDHTLNMIDFSVDRFIVDKSNTFDYNINLTVPAWTQLPSNTPTPVPINQYDMPVLFPRKTILPKSVDY